MVTKEQYIIQNTQRYSPALRVPGAGKNRNRFLKTAVSAALVLLLAAALLCGGAAGATVVTVTTENELLANFTDDHVVKLGNDIYLTDPLGLLSGAVTLDLNGHNLTAAADKRLFTINGGTFTLNGTGGGCLVGNGTVNGNGGGVSVSGGTFIMNSGSITDCNANNGGGVFVDNGGSFTMSGGSIVNCSTAKKGAGVYIQNSGIFTMSGGSIEDCSAAQKGGGVYLYSSTGYSIFTMLSSSSIENCTASENGGGVYAASRFIVDGGSITDCKVTGGDGYGGGVSVIDSFTLKSGSITDCSATYGGGVYVEDEFTMNGGSIDDCSATYGGGVYNYEGTTVLSGGSISGNTASVGAGLLTSPYISVTLGGNMQIGENDNDFALYFEEGYYSNLICNSSTGYVKNITLYDDSFTLNSAAWSGQSVVADGKDYAENFALSSLHTGYTLEAGTGGQANDLVLAEYKEPYVEVNSWEELNTAVSEWTSTTSMRTVVVTGDITDRADGANVDGIAVTGLVTVKAAQENSEYMIDGKQFGRIFNIISSGDLTLAGNSSAVLNITGASYSDDGGGVYVDGGNLTLSSNAKITRCSSDNYGGGVSVTSYGLFTMSDGSITGCSAKCGGGVFVSGDGTFTMSGGSITGCSAEGIDNMFIKWYGGGVIIITGTFDVSGTAEITGNTLTVGTVNNVYLTLDNQLNLTGPFSGTVGINFPVIVNSQFGLAAEDASGAENFIPDTEGYLAEKSGTVLRWVLKEYAITYELNGGTNAETNPASYNLTTDTVTLADASRTGHTFEGWYNSSVFTAASRNNTIPAGSTGDRTFCANYTAHTYNVTFNNNTGVGTMENQTFTYDIAQTLTAVTFTKPGFTFAGWNATDASGTGVDYADKASVKNLTADDKDTVTLYAVWTKVQPAPPAPSKSGSSGNYGTSVWLQETAGMHTVTFVMNGHGTQIVSRNVAHGSAAAEPSPAPSAEGYVFSGWYTDSSLTSKYDFSTPVTGDITLYACWTATPSASNVKPAQQTPASPVPFAGLLAGLGAAAVFSGLRRK